MKHLVVFSHTIKLTATLLKYGKDEYMNINNLSKGLIILYLIPFVFVVWIIQIGITFELFHNSYLAFFVDLLGIIRCSKLDK